ncbi:hypothetical protein FANTH_11062 [Fusarium anthophilum]|uniref:Uncharacterized protein n=1 Tax=Fusarium anthophilum TaxID=48485 RepID=A0A8H4YYW4_9HYPO|nr:hypothetical protein FANTH_11062 [Fusarium anthophilum]
MKDIVLPDSLSDFTEWIGGIAEPQAFGLQPRQRQCVDAGYYPCSSGLGCCPEGSTCISTGCCRGNAKECGSGRCYDPSSQVCCSSGTACLKSQTCFVAVVLVGIVPRVMTACQVVAVVHLARSDVATASVTTHEQQLVVLDLELFGPVQSPTIKSTETVTTTKMKTVRVTTDIEPDTGNAPEFTCVPMTATNDEGATLELDDGCTLHYEPPEATTTDDSAARLRRDAATAPAHVNRGHNPLARQVSCTPYTIYTRTEWETETETETGTKTVTVQGEDATFSCPEMEVTNDVGDTLALDAECVLSFTPAETTSSEEGASAQDQPTNVPAGTGESTTTVTATAGSGGSNDNSGSVERASVSLMLSFAGIAMFGLVF